MIFLKAVLKAISPLKIGSGLDDSTDNDVLLGGDGKPFIPGSSICGVCRHFFKDIFKNDSDFGKEIPPNEQNNEKQMNDIKSKYVFYDAEILNDYSISVRDNVKIGENGVAEDKAKFDYEFIEAGAEFSLRIEYDGTIENIKKIILAINNGDITLGGKTTRGYGKMEVLSSCFREINLETNIDDYINFSWNKVTAPLVITSENNPLESENPYVAKFETEKFAVYEIDFKLASYLFLRDYSSDKKIKNEITKEEKYVDVGSLIVLNDAKDTHIIPGTAWAGVFRHHIKRILDIVNYSNKNSLDTDKNFLDADFLDTVFGIAEKEPKIKSNIRFETSFLKDTKSLNRTRTAVDRFTGGAGDGMLYTSNVAVGGGGNLRIFLKKDIENFSFAENLIFLVVDDLAKGYVTVGGESSVGAGILDLTEVKK
jgi:CRISPR/Cas system CSM-associated protein Csm3 (group 7 of RAMP superfamily)